MIEYIADKIKKENEAVKIPYDKVVHEEQKRVSQTEVIVTYIFTDTSSVSVRYTLDDENIIKRTKGTIEGKLKKTY